jgi:hypothetical protein
MTMITLPLRYLKVYILMSSIRGCDDLGVALAEGMACRAAGLYTPHS